MNWHLAFLKKDKRKYFPPSLFAAYLLWTSLPPHSKVYPFSNINRLSVFVYCGRILEFLFSNCFGAWRERDTPSFLIPISLVTFHLLLLPFCCTSLRITQSNLLAKANTSITGFLKLYIYIYIYILGVVATTNYCVFWVWFCSWNNNPSVKTTSKFSVVKRQRSHVLKIEMLRYWRLVGWKK